MEGKRLGKVCHDLTWWLMSILLCCCLYASMLSLCFGIAAWFTRRTHGEEKDVAGLTWPQNTGQLLVGT